MVFLAVHHNYRKAGLRRGTAASKFHEIRDNLRCAKDTGLDHFPPIFAINQAWLTVVMLAVDLIAWTQHLLLSGDLAKAEPKALRSAATRRRPAHPRTTSPLATHPAHLAVGPRPRRGFARLTTLPVPAG